MDYPKSVPSVGLVNGKFVDEDPGAGTPGSLIPSAWGNAVTQELLNVIEAAGFAPAEDQTNQLLKAIQGLVSQGIKNSVRVATTGPIALSGVQTIDAIVLVAGDRVLVKNQASGAQNGIYVVAAGAWVRALDADESFEVKPGMLVGVDAGTVNGGSVWRLSNAEPPTLGTTALTFEQAFGKTGVVAGSYRSVKVGADGRVTEGTNPTTLAEYGITDAVKIGDKALQADAEGGADNEKWVTVAVVSVAISTAFAGCVAHFARNTAPGGWLKANGALVSRTTYSRLFNAIGTTFGAGDGATTFQLPDLRGLFVRGWDDGRGMNPGRDFATYEADELKSHAHDLIVNSTDTGGNKIADSNGAGTNSTASTSATGGTETRPRNLALLACIKY